MDIKLHKLARTTPAVRAAIQASDESAAVLARRYGVSQSTIYKWRGLKRVHDGSHCRHNLQQSTSPQHEELIGELRSRLRLSLDDIHEVMNRCFEETFSRSALYRCLKRLGLNRLPRVKERNDFGCFEETGCGFIHIDLKVLSKLDGRPSYVFVAIDRATRYVFVKMVERRDARTMCECLRSFLCGFPHRVHTILTDNDGAFTDRFAVLKKNKPKGRPSGRHPFDAACREHDIEHRLTRPYRPQTNGMVERFNRRISEALRGKAAIRANYGKNKFHNHEERNHFIYRFVDNYNQTRLKCLGYKAPAEVLSDQAELYTFAGMARGVRGNGEGDSWQGWQGSRQW